MQDGKLIQNVQALRALAALAVVLYHTNLPIAGVSSSYFGVELFFCISGFVMTYVSRTEGALPFVQARLVRIVPLYWLATIAYFLWTRSGLSNPPYVWPLLWERLWNDLPALWHWMRTNVVLDAATWSALLKSLLFIPYENGTGTLHPLLGVGWTLNLEMAFYLLFAGALALHRELAPVIVAAALLLVRAMLAGTPGPPGFYASSYLNYFIFGIACYYAWAGWPARARTPGRTTVHGTAAAMAALYLWSGWWTQGKAQGDNPLAGLLGIFVPPLALLVALWCHRLGLQVRNAGVLQLGAASYALYLFHPFVMETARPVGNAWPWANTSASLVGATLAVLLSVGLALVVHRWVEQPLLALLKKRVTPRRRSALPWAASGGQR